MKEEKFLVKEQYWSRIGAFGVKVVGMTPVQMHEKTWHSLSWDVERTHYVKGLDIWQGILSSQKAHKVETLYLISNFFVHLFTYLTMISLVILGGYFNIFS